MLCRALKQTVGLYLYSPVSIFKNLLTQGLCRLKKLNETVRLTDREHDDIIFRQAAL